MKSFRTKSAVSNWARVKRGDEAETLKLVENRKFKYISDGDTEKVAEKKALAFAVGR